MSDRQHSELGASSCARWWNCPGSVRMSRGAERRDSVHSLAGTAAHDVAETCLRSGQDAIEFVDRQVGGVHITAETAENVQVYLDDCRSLTPNTVLPANVRVEVQFDLAPLHPPAPMFGTADFVGYATGWQKLFVKDYKNGFLEVAAEGNPQLKYYALGAMLAFGEPVSEVEVAIVQRGRVKTATYGAVELAEWSIELMDHAAATQAPDAPLAAGSWCKFCPVSGRCPAQADAAMSAALVEFSTLFEPEPQLPDLAMLTPADLAVIQGKIPLLEAWIAAVQAVNIGLAERGELPGWKAVAKQGRRAWRDADATTQTMLLDEMLPDSVVFAPPMLRSPAQFEKALADFTAAAGGTKKAALAAAKALTAEHTHSPSGGVTLAPDSDPRPAVAGGGTEFAALPAPDETAKE